MRLCESLQSFDRDITKLEWIEIWRWIRVTRKQLANQEKEMIALLKEDLPEYIRSDILYKLINPPLLIHSRQHL